MFRIDKRIGGLNICSIIISCISDYCICFDRDFRIGLLIDCYDWNCWIGRVFVVFICVDQYDVVCCISCVFVFYVFVY